MSSSHSKQVSQSMETLDLHDISTLLQSLSGRCKTLQSNYVTEDMLQKMKSEIEASLLKKLSLNNDRLKAVEGKCDDLKLTDNGLQDDLKVCQDNIKSLTAKMEERISKSEAELIVATCTEKINIASSELLSKQNILEERTTGLLRILSDDIDEKVSKWKLKQRIHEMELERLKEVVEKLSARPKSISPTLPKSNNQNLTDGPVSPPDKDTPVPTRDAVSSSTEKAATQQSVQTSKPMHASSSPVQDPYIYPESPSTSGTRPSTLNSEDNALISELIGTKPNNSTGTNAIQPPTTLKHSPLQPSGIFGHICSCGKRFTSKSDLNNHIRGLNTGPKFTCSDCQIPFYGRVPFRNHMKDFHSLLLLPDKTKARVRGPQKRKLTRCGTQAPTRIRSSINARNAAAKPDSKPKHGKVQKLAGETYLPISCLCGYKFDSVAEFSTHLDHFELDSKLKFLCSLCRRRFPTKKVLMEHNKSAHEKVPTPNASQQAHTKNMKNLNRPTAHATPSSSNSPQNPKLVKNNFKDDFARLPLSKWESKDGTLPVKRERNGDFTVIQF